MSKAEARRIQVATRQQMKNRPTEAVLLLHARLGRPGLPETPPLIPTTVG